MIPFSPPFVDVDVVNEVNNALASGWITSGPKVKELENLVAQISNRNYCIAVNSATSGLIAVLKWFGVGPGDEVIIPAYTYAATALAVHHVGAKPVMVDIRNDFNIDVDQIAKAINEKTKVIIPVDIAGWPADYGEIYSIVNKPEIISLFKPSTDVQKKLGRLLILSDAAHSIGAKYKGKPTGSLADITVFSFHAVKNVTTAEGGGIVLNLPESFNEVEVYNYFKLLTLNGQTKDAYSKTKGGGWRYDIVFPGHKMNMPDVLAAIGLAQIRKYKNYLLLERKRVATLYSTHFERYSWAILPEICNGESESSYHIYPLRIKNITEMQRDAMIDYITKQNVSVNVHFIPLPMFTFFKELGYNIDDYQNAYRNYSCEISLPIYPQLTDEQVKMVVSAVVSAFNNVIGL